MKVSYDMAPEGWSSRYDILAKDKKRWAEVSRDKKRQLVAEKYDALAKHLENRKRKRKMNGFNEKVGVFTPERTTTFGLLQSMQQQ